MNLGQGYPETATKLAEEMPRKQSLTDRLSAERARLNARIQEIDTVLDALRKVPEVEAVIDLIFKHV